MKLVYTGFLNWQSVFFFKAMESWTETYHSHATVDWKMYLLSSFFLLSVAHSRLVLSDNSDFSSFSLLPFLVIGLASVVLFNTKWSHLTSYSEFCFHQHFHQFTCCNDWCLVVRFYDLRRGYLWEHPRCSPKNLRRLINFTTQFQGLIFKKKGHSQIALAGTESLLSGLRKKTNEDYQYGEAFRFANEYFHFPIVLFDERWFNQTQPHTSQISISVYSSISSVK